MLAYLQYAAFDIVLILWTKCNLKYNNTYHIKVGWIAEWFVFTFLAAFRYVGNHIGGADSEHYVESFLTGIKLSSEPLLYQLNSLIRLFTENYHIYFFVVYGIIVFGLLFFAKNIFDKNTNWLSLFFFFNIYCTSFGVMRQWLAISIGMVAFVMLKKEKDIMALFIALISTGVHFTMIVYVAIILLYIFFRHNHYRINYRFFLCYAFMINILFVFISDLFIRFIGSTEYRNYVNINSLSDVSWRGYIPTIIFLIICLFFEKDIRLGNKNDEIGLVFLCINLSLMYATVALGMFRLTVLFWPIRAYMIDRVRPVLARKFVWEKENRYFIIGLYDFAVLFICIVYMWRTVGNSALPYVFSFY